MKPFPICDKTITAETIQEDILILDAAAAVTNDFEGVTTTREFLQKLHDLMYWYGAEIRIQKGDEWEPPYALLFLQAGPEDPPDAELYGVAINPDTITLLINSLT